MMGRFEDLTGRVFSKLRVISRAPTRHRHTMYLCVCECGTEKQVLAKNLVSGRTKSCGCVRGTEQHGKCGTRTYRSWVSMKQRCLNPNATGYERYGARGVTIHPAWLKFSGFLADMGERPAGTSLERLNNAGNYEPGNCVWATPKEQANNRRTRNDDHVHPNQPPRYYRLRLR